MDRSEDLILQCNALSSAVRAPVLTDDNIHKGREG